MILLLVSFCDESPGNSYSYNALPEKWVPREFRAFANWRNPYGDDSAEVTRAMLEVFLKKGTWSRLDPWLEQRKKMKGPSGQFRFDNDPEYHKALERFALEQEALRREFSGLSGVEGAIGLRLPEELGKLAKREEGIFLWSLESPRVMRLEWGGFLCYLTLSKVDAVAPKKREFPIEPAPIPDLPAGKLIIQRDFLPGSGPFQVLPPKAIREFVARGRRAEGFEITDRLDLGVSTYWFGATRDGFPEKIQDSHGNFIIADVYRRGSFKAVFQDRDGSLWRAKLLTDCHLQLEDSKGRRVILEHPALLEKGIGKLPPEPKAESPDPFRGN